MDVTIIIINYNTKEITNNCINSIYEHSFGFTYEIILVDNCSNDGSNEYFMYNNRLKYIQLKKNYGFGYANNIAAKISVGDFLFFLNSDTLLLNNSIKFLLEYFTSKNESKIGFLGTFLFDGKMNLNTSYFKFPGIRDSVISELNQILLRLKNKKLLIKNETVNYKRIICAMNVDCISGAAMMIPKKIFMEYNGFDTDYFLYFEETDLQKKMKLKGLSSRIIDGPKIIHFENQSTALSMNFLQYKNQYIKSLFLYFKKNHSKSDYIFLRIIMAPLLMRFLFLKVYKFQDRKEFFKTIFFR